MLQSKPCTTQLTSTKRAQRDYAAPKDLWLSGRCCDGQRAGASGCIRVSHARNAQHKSKSCKIANCPAAELRSGNRPCLRLTTKPAHQRQPGQKKGVLQPVDLPKPTRPKAVNDDIYHPFKGPFLFPGSSWPWSHTRKWLRNSSGMVAVRPEFETHANLIGTKNVDGSAKGTIVQRLPATQLVTLRFRRVDNIGCKLFAESALLCAQRNCLCCQIVLPAKEKPAA